MNPTTELTGVGTISGRVVTPDGRPLSGAAVTMPDHDNNAPPIATTTTDHRGEFSLPLRMTEHFPIHRRSPMLRAEADGWAEAGSSTVSLRSSAFTGRTRGVRVRG